MPIYVFCHLLWEDLFPSLAYLTALNFSFRKGLQVSHSFSHSLCRSNADEPKRSLTDEIEETSYQWESIVKGGTERSDEYSVAKQAPY